MDNLPICALATSLQNSAISLIRISGQSCLKIIDTIFSKKISSAPTHTIHFGKIIDNEKIIDEVLISIFHKGKSFTGEEMAEISCHASPYIVKSILELLVLKGCQLAKSGEFTMRAFMNGKIDLVQAEAIPDLIKAETLAEHKTAMYSMRGGFSLELKELRGKLIDFTSLLELELDFSQEDVEFADRKNLLGLIDKILKYINNLLINFKDGNAIKNGISVVIAGKPNVGKSTLLNALLNEEKAIVTDIPGTTRDVIEDVIVLEDVKFRFVDTAGLRKTEDIVEAKGIEKTISKIAQTQILIYLYDINKTTEKEIQNEIKPYKNKGYKLVIVGNKIDEIKDKKGLNSKDIIYISAKSNMNIDELKSRLIKLSSAEDLNSVIITNIRHYGHLLKAKESLEMVIEGLKNNRSTELISADLKDALNQIGEITGEITNDDILKNIFGRFCIGK